MSTPYDAEWLEYDDDHGADASRRERVRALLREAVELDGNDEFPHALTDAIEAFLCAAVPAEMATASRVTPGRGTTGAVNQDDCIRAAHEDPLASNRQDPPPQVPGLRQGQDGDYHAYVASQGGVVDGPPIEGEGELL